LDKKTAMILTLVGGIFYVIGGLLAGLVVGGLTAFTGGLTGNPQALQEASNHFATIFGTGLITGIIIIIGSVMINSNSSKLRKVGGIIAIIMALLGIVNTLGGLLIGFILTMVGSIYGITYAPLVKM
jgi:hypothetical protein